jgi:hypothetical protein
MVGPNTSQHYTDGRPWTSKCPALVTLSLILIATIFFLYADLLPEIGIAAAIGKVGAFVGNYIFPDIIAAGGNDPVKQGQYPFFVSSALCIFSGIITLIFIPNIGQDTIDNEDARFKEYLKQHGYDIDTLGTEEFKARRHSVTA